MDDTNFTVMGQKFIRDNFGDDWHAEELCRETLTPQIASVFCEVLMPAFREVNGVVFLANRYDRYAIDQFLSSGTTLQSLQGLINHVHLYDIFKFDNQQEDLLPVLRYIMSVMQKSWANALNLAYPNRSFTVYCSDEPEDYGPTITFTENIDAQTQADSNA